LVVVGGVIDGLWRLRLLSVTSVKFIFLLFDKEALARPVPLVLAIDTAVWDFLLSSGVVSAAAVGVASVAPPSSIVLRMGVARFVARDCVHCLRGLRLIGLVRPRSFTVLRSLLVHLFKSSPLALVRDAILLHYLEELVDGLGLAALEVLSTRPKAYGWVEAGWPLELFEFHGERGAGASTVLPMLLLHHSVVAFFIRVHIFLDDDGSWARPDWLVGEWYDGYWLAARGLAL
jgi:hypothetical protein